MNIIHYALGFPPYRTGGMTKYCLDLMSEQVKVGHKVGMLWPGRIKNYSSSIKIRKARYEKTDRGELVLSFEIINPLPVSLLNGIKEISVFSMPKDISVFKNYFLDNKVQVFHIHTLMGLPIECVIAAKKTGVRIIYSMHDYFGICPKWGLIHDGKICVDDHDCIDCVDCNNTALSLGKIKFLQSSLYKEFKNSSLVALARKKHNDSLYAESNKNGSDLQKQSLSLEKKKLAEKYVMLRDYYKNIWGNTDVLHFNSVNTKNIFERYYYHSRHSEILLISHASISDNRKLRKYNNTVRFGYLGPITEHKGFYFLKNVLDSLFQQGERGFELHIFVTYDKDIEYIVKHEPYKYKDLENVMNQFDILVVPSQWYETFGFTVLEALSYGVPVVVTSNVGAKDLIENRKNGIIVEPNAQTLQEELKRIINNHNIIEDMNKFIVENTAIKTMECHEKEVENVLYAIPRKV